MSILSSSRIEKLAAALLIAGTAFLGLLAVGELRDLWQTPDMVGTTITVDGEGKVTAVPNIAEITFSVTADAKTASLAKEDAAKKNNIALELLKNMGIDEKSIKTTSYQINPKYSYQQPCYGAPCPFEEPRIIGYTVTQSTQVKVEVEKVEVGDVLSALGDAGVGILNTPMLTVEDIDAKREEARELAIKAAKAKADKLAKDLGVRVVRVVSFNEGGYGYPAPYMSARSDMAMGAAMEKISPEIAPGESEIRVNVSVTYEIR